MRAAIIATLLLAPLAAWADDTKYITEEHHDTPVSADDALVNVVLANNRWPDCSTNATAIADIFRIEGVQTKPDQEKALALAKWFRLLMSAHSAPTFEGPVCGHEEIVFDPHKILTVYGAHFCDGMSWAAVSLWRAAGYMGLDECHSAHTIASLRYRDADGQLRFHDFDVEHQFVYWDGKHDWAGTWSLPLMRGLVHRRLNSPLTVHTLWTSLRAGETIDRKWDGEGYVVFPGKPELKLDPGKRSAYFAYTPGRRDGIFSAAGEEQQTFVADTNTLPAESKNAAILPLPLREGRSEGRGLLHPTKSGATAELIYPMSSPYVALEGTCQATLTKGDPDDVCRLLLSRDDGAHWEPIFDKKSTGEEKVTIDLGRAAREQGKPHIYTAYNFLIKAELSSEKDANKVGLSGLNVTLFRELNKRTLPNLLPGENVLRVTADKIAAGKALQLEVHYRVNGKSQVVTETVSHFPHYFKIDVPGVKSRVLANYDKDFNNDPLQMESLKMTLGAAGKESPSLSATEGEAAFAASCPNPQLAELVVKKEVPTYESNVMQTSGFFPQSTAVWTDQVKYAKLIETFKDAKGVPSDSWVAAEDLGNYPAAVDLLCEELPKADSDLSMFIVKALGQIHDKKAIKPLLASWQRAPGGAPANRYVPDALAAIGDPSVVPALIIPLAKCRFDYRFHIAHALGILGGPQAEETLSDLAKNDPFPANREEATDALATAKALAANPSGDHSAKPKLPAGTTFKESDNRQGSGK